MKKLLIVIAAFALIVGAGVAIATANTDNKPGYAQFTLENVQGLEPKMSFNLGRMGLKPLMWLAGASEQPEAQFLKNIEAVKLQVFDVTGNSDDIHKQLGGSLKSLTDNGWEKIVVVNEENEKIRILTLTDGELFKGVLISVTNEREAVLINVMGSLHNNDLQQLVAMSNEW